MPNTDATDKPQRSKHPHDYIIPIAFVLIVISCGAITFLGVL